MFDLNLKLFATDSATNYDQTTTQTTTVLTPEMKTYYEKRLIELAEPNLVHSQFGDQYPIPKNGGKTIEFRQYSSLPNATTPITEGVTPNGNSLTVTTITATVDQYGDWIGLSDLLELSAIDNNVVQATKLLGAQAGRTKDALTRDVLAGGTNVLYASKWSGTTETEATSRLDLDNTATLNVDAIFKAAAILNAQNAPYIDGESYVAIIHPYAAYDLMRSDGWIDVHKYSDPEAIFKGEIGKLGNVRFVESSQAKVWKDGTCPATVAAFDATKTYAVGDVVYHDDTVSGVTTRNVYTCKTAITSAAAWDASKWTKETDVTKNRYGVFSTLVLGANAFGETEITGGGLEHIVKQLGYGDDPLNQRGSTGWKMTHVAKRLVETYMVRIESLSKFSAKVSAN